MAQCLHQQLQLAGRMQKLKLKGPQPSRQICVDNPSLQSVRSKRHICVASAAAAGASDAGDLQPSSSSSSNGVGPHTPQQQSGPLAWLKERFGSSKLDKQKLAEYGLGAFAAYGVISNLNAGVLVTMSWLTVVKQTGLTPLDPGMWPRFLGIYAGLYVAIGSILRPLRLTAALAVAPLFNRFLDTLQRTFKVNKAVAFGIMLGCIAVSSFTLISCMLVLAGGFPNGPPPLPWKRG